VIAPACIGESSKKNEDVKIKSNRFMAHPPWIEPESGSAGANTPCSALRNDVISFETWDRIGKLYG
jgi:hypothetical protein